MPAPLRKLPPPAPKVEAVKAAPASATVVVDLDHPIQAHGEEVDALEFHRLKAGDLMKLDGLGDMAQAAKLIELSAKIPPASVAQLDGADFTRCAAAVAGFFGDGRVTGRKR